MSALVPLLLLCLLVVLLGVESYLVFQSTKHLDIKVHVNGTRGKSTVTRYIYTLLNDHGVATLGKITGEIPTLLLPDGQQKMIQRRGPARVQEQFKTIIQAKKYGAKALVLECMSINPALQKLESSFYKPGIYLITNIRDDHREQMGFDMETQIQSICQAIPKQSTVIAVKSSYVDQIKAATLMRKSEFVECLKLTAGEVAALPQGTHKTNVELALTVGKLVGVDRNKAFEALINLEQEPASPVYSINGCVRNAYFLNAFPVNDPQSASVFINHWKEQLAVDSKIAVVLNVRSDRPLRTSLFVEWIGLWNSQIERVLITGSHRWKAKHELRRQCPDLLIECVALGKPDRLVSKVYGLANDSPLIVGIGNLQGGGYLLVNKISSAS